MSVFDRRRRGEDDQSAPSSPQANDADIESVEGERGVSAVQRPPSLQSRLSNLLALGLMGTLGVGFLGWYYAKTLGTRSNAHLAAQSAVKEKAKGEITLRPLGRVDPPVNVSPPSAYTLQEILGAPPDAPPNPPLTRSGGATDATATPAAVAAKTPRELLMERQLAGPAFAASEPRVTGIADEAGVHSAAENASVGDLDKLLHPRNTPAANAQMLPTRRLLLPKGAFIDCTLETAIDSTLPGMTTCIMATDTFSADGSVVLMERGTKLVGRLAARSSRVRRGYSCCGPKPGHPPASSCPWPLRGPTNSAAQAFRVR